MLDSRYVPYTRRLTVDEALVNEKRERLEARHELRASREANALAHRPQYARRIRKRKSDCRPPIALAV